MMITKRVVKIGDEHITIEDGQLLHADIETLTDVLSHAYPEVKNAAIRFDSQDEIRNNTQNIEFLPKVGRKG